MKTHRVLSDVRRRDRPLTRPGLVCVVGIAALLGAASPAMAAGDKPSPASNCIAIWYANQAFGNVGQDTSYFATLAPGEVGDFSSTFGRVHAGSVEACNDELGW